MKIPGINAYNTYTNNSSEDKTELMNARVNGSRNTAINEAVKKIKDEIIISNKNLVGNSINTDKIITKQERKYFIKMFPESSAIIENHVLFNRNGKVTTPQINKGVIVDGKI